VERSIFGTERIVIGSVLPTVKGSSGIEMSPQVSDEITVASAYREAQRSGRDCKLQVELET
jgi:hypothetical protein